MIKPESEILLLLTSNKHILVNIKGALLRHLPVIRYSALSGTNHIYLI
jgi:hypothetical protein